jgi:hypothetical protein
MMRTMSHNADRMLFISSSRSPDGVLMDGVSFSPRYRMPCNSMKEDISYNVLGGVTNVVYLPLPSLRRSGAHPSVQQIGARARRVRIPLQKPRARAKQHMPAASPTIF